MGQSCRKFSIFLNIYLFSCVNTWPGWLNELGSYLTTHTSLSPIQCGFAPSFVNYKKGCTRPAAASDKVYQLLAHGQWFSPGTPASSTTKTGHHDIAEILLKVELNTKNQIKSSSVNKIFDLNRVCFVSLSTCQLLLIGFIVNSKCVKTILLCNYHIRMQ